MNRDFTFIVDQILDTSFNSLNVNSFLNGVQVALNLGKSDPNYTYPAFKYLINVLAKTEFKDLLGNKEKNFNTSLHSLMIEAFIHPHLDHGIALPENFTHIFNYFKKDIFKPDNDHKFESAKYRGHLRFIRSCMYQTENLFNSMIDILKNNPSYITIQEPKLFFSLLDQTFNDYYKYNQEQDKNVILNRKLTFYLHEKVFQPFNIKSDYDSKVNNQEQNIVFNHPDNLLHLQKLLNVIIEPNEDHLKLNYLYNNNKKSDTKVCNTIIQNIEPISTTEFYLEMLSFLKCNYIKLFTVGNVIKKFSQRANYVSFASICANSTDNYNTDIITHTGSRWFKSNSNEDQIEIFEHFSDQYKCQILLNRLYSDFIICPHRDDLRISLLSHLDKNCLSHALEHFSQNKDSIIENLKDLPKNQDIYLSDFKYEQILAPISHLLFAYQENPVVVFHAIKLQSIDHILKEKKTKKYICTTEELNTAEQQAYFFINQIANSFSHIKTYLADLRISPVMLNESANPSYLSKNEDTLIPLNYKQPTQKYSGAEINNLYSAYSYFILEHKIGSNKKDQALKKNKI